MQEPLLYYKFKAKLLNVGNTDYVLLLLEFNSLCLVLGRH